MKARGYLQSYDRTLSSYSNKYFPDQVSCFFIYLLGKCSVSNIKSCSLFSKKKSQHYKLALSYALCILYPWLQQYNMAKNKGSALQVLNKLSPLLFLVLVSMVKLTVSFDLSHLILAQTWNHEPCYILPLVLYENLVSLGSHRFFYF